MTSSSPAPACSRRVWSSGKCWQATRLLLWLRKGGIFVEHAPRSALLDHTGKLVRVPASVYGAYDCSVCYDRCEASPEWPVASVKTSSPLCSQGRTCGPWAKGGATPTENLEDWSQRYRASVRPLTKQGTMQTPQWLVYLRDGSAQTILHAATLRQKLQIKVSISASHSLLIPGQPVPVLTLYRQAPDRVATGVPILCCESPVMMITVNNVASNTNQCHETASLA